MNFVEHSTAGNIINKYQNGQVYVNHLAINPPLLLTTHSHKNWQNADINNLTANVWQQILNLAPKIILIGTGATHIFIHPEHIQPLINSQIGFEIMSTSAACNTFNVLVSEDRDIVAGFFA